MENFEKKNPLGILQTEANVQMTIVPLSNTPTAIMKMLTLDMQLEVQISKFFQWIISKKKPWEFFRWKQMSTWLWHYRIQRLYWLSMLTLDMQLQVPKLKFSETLWIASTMLQTIVSSNLNEKESLSFYRLEYLKIAKLFKS